MPQNQKDPIAQREEFGKRILGHDYAHGPLLLLSGPGTGKTYCLLKTIQAQMTRGLVHSEFFEATLTNAAADDFISEAKKEIAPGFESSSTLHHRAKGILHQRARLIDLNPNFTIIDDLCEKLLLRDISHILGDSLENMEKALREHRKASAMDVPTESRFSDVYQTIQLFYAALDWFDVMGFTCRLLVENREVQREESNSFKFLLVDEYQDLNPAEQRFIELLLNGRKQLLVAGDDDQSIYSGRYANPASIVCFSDRYPEASTEVLTVTSRLPSAVVGAAHSLISKNKSRKPKPKLTPLPTTEKRTGGGFVISANLKSGKAEREFIGEALHELLNKAEIPPARILVLCNYRLLGIELITAIQESGKKIPIQNDLKDPGAPDRDRELLGYVQKFLVDQNNNLCLRMVLHRILESQPDDCSLLAATSVKTGQSLWETLKSEKTTRQLTNTSSAIAQFVEVVEEAIKLNDVGDRLTHLFSRIDSLNKMLELLEGESEPANEAMDIDQPEETAQAVRFITLHSSKGLDADFVFIPFLEKSIGLPAASKEEQRRLLYVGVTRAKVGVVFSWAWSRHSEARHKRTGGGGPSIRRKPSPFIAECGINPSICLPNASPSPPELAKAILLKYAAKVNAFEKTQAVHEG